MIKPTEMIFTGTGGKVTALNRLNGGVLWQTKVGGSSFVTVIADDTMVYAQAMGKLLALDLMSGKILWENGLAGCGYGLGCLAFPGGMHSWPGPMARIQEESDSSSSSAGGTAGA